MTLALLLAACDSPTSSYIQPSSAPSASPTVSSGGTSIEPVTDPTIDGGTGAAVQNRVGVCTSAREIGLPPRSTTEPAEVHALTVTVSAPDRVEVSGAPEGAEIELFSGELGAECTRLPSGGCQWVTGDVARATVVAGVAAFTVDVATGLTVQAHDPATGATTPAHWSTPDVTGSFGEGLVRIVPEGTYSGFTWFDGVVWVEQGDYVTVTGTIDEGDSGMFVDAPPGSLVETYPVPYQNYTWSGVIGASGWMTVYLSAFCWCDATTSVTIDVAPALVSRPWFADLDEDGHGDPASTFEAMTRPAGFAGSADDCDDASADVHAGAGELCGDGVDSDCDLVDEPCLTLDDALVPAVPASVSGSNTAWLRAAVPVGDFDGDGRRDIVLESYEGSLLAPSSRGDFCRDTSVFPDDLGGFRVVGDDDGDGIAAVLVPTDEGLRLVRGMPEGPVADVGRLVPGFQDPRGRVYEDLTGDGLPEITSLRSWSGYAEFDAFEAPFEEGDPPLATWTDGFDTFTGLPDLDGDGLGEVGLSNDDEVLVGFGPHTGTAPVWDVTDVIWEAPTGFSWLWTAGDLDGDGTPELVVSGNGASLYFLGEVDAIGATEIGHLDFDGYTVILDLAVVDGDLWFTSTGLLHLAGPLVGAFDAVDLAQHDPGLEVPVQQLAADDLDLDGATDLVVHSDMDGGAAWILFGIP